MTALLRLSMLAVFAAMLAASPARADVIDTFYFYDRIMGAGDVVLDATTYHLLYVSNWEVGPTPSQWQPFTGFAGYNACGGQICFTQEAETLNLIQIDPSTNAEEGYFSFAIQWPLGIGEDGNVALNSFATNNFSVGGPLMDGGGGSITLLSQTGVPEPPSMWLLVSGLIFIFFAARQLRTD